MAAQLCEYTENHWVIHFKWMDYMVSEFYLNNLLKK